LSAKYLRHINLSEKIITGGNMPILKKPTGIKKLIRLLLDIVLTGNQDNLAGRNYVQQATLDAIAAFIPDFQTAHNRVLAASEDKMKEVREKGESLTILEKYCRDTWENVRRRKERMNHPPEILAYYGLPLDGISPHPDSATAWLDIAQAIIDGDGRAVADGYPTILSPSVAEIQAVLDTANAEYADFAMADRTHDEALAAQAKLRPTGEEFADDVYEQLMFNTRKMDKPSQRRIARTYGYKYDYSPGEPPEEVPAAPVLTVDFIRPNMTVSCNEVETATGYQFVYSEDEINWTELYAGENNSYTYQPPAGRRVYRVRAENEYGYGDWSEEVEYTVEEVPA